MHSQLNRDLLRKVSERLAGEIGLYFGENRLSDLEKGLVAASADLHMGKASQLATSILAGKLKQEQVEVLARHLSVGETYFFRDKRSFDVLRQLVLPQLIAQRRSQGRRLRIWCAGCASGEEVYSIAIALREVIRDVTNWSLTILGTDISPVALQTAESGEYGEWSFRSTPQWIHDRYFERISHRKWRIKSEVRRMAEFSFLNLARDGYPSVETNTNAMDIVFCRNVLMYFSAEQARSVAGRLERAVGPEGWLFVSPSEASRSLFPSLAVQDIPEFILFRKVHQQLTGRKDNESGLPATLSFAETERASGKGTSSQPVARFRSPENDRAASRDEVAGLSEAKVLWEKGRLHEAERTLLRFLQDEPNSEALELLARICADDGRIELALRWCEKALAADKLNASLRFLRASIMQELDNAEAVVGAYREVLYLEPHHVLSHYALASHYRRMGRTRDANLHFRNAVALLSGYSESAVLPGSDGLTAGWLLDAIRSAVPFERSAHWGGKQE